MKKFLLQPCKFLKKSHSREHVSIYTVKSEPLFVQHFDGPIYPTLRLLHKCEFFVFVLFLVQWAIPSDKLKVC